MPQFVMTDLDLCAGVDIVVAAYAQTPLTKLTIRSPSGGMRAELTDAELAVLLNNLWTLARTRGLPVTA